MMWFGLAGRGMVLGRIGSQDDKSRGGGLAAAGEDSLGRRTSELSVCLSVSGKEL